MPDRTFLVESDKQREYLVSFIGRRALPFQAVVGEIHEQRSISQNARLWKLHSMAAEHTGYSADEMHEFALCKHFGYSEKQATDPMTGEVVLKRVPLKRSSMRNKQEFRAFMDSTEAWYGTELGVWLP